jgi:2-hydroxychromene-2-carboxylate isomerase
MSAKNRPPRLYFSFRSPYSWLAVNRLREAVPDVFEAFDLYPYWDPDEQTSRGLADRGGEFHYVQMSRAKHLYMLLDTKRVAERQGRVMAWPIDVDPWWELPHLAWLYARREGRMIEFYDAVTEARWGRGEDVCTADVVHAAAKQAGLDPDGAVRAPDDLSLRTEAVDCLYQAYLDDIFGIPYLKWGRHRYWGLDRVDAFLQAWQPSKPLRSQPGPQPQEPDPLEADMPESNLPQPWLGIPAVVLDGAQVYDRDTAGGCG